MRSTDTLVAIVGDEPPESSPLPRCRHSKATKRPVLDSSFPRRSSQGVSTAMQRPSETSPTWRHLTVMMPVPQPPQPVVRHNGLQLALVSARNS